MKNTIEDPLKITFDVAEVTADKLLSIGTHYLVDLSVAQELQKRVEELDQSETELANKLYAANEKIDEQQKLMAEMAEAINNHIAFLLNNSIGHHGALQLTVDKYNEYINKQEK